MGAGELACATVCAARMESALNLATSSLGGPRLLAVWDLAQLVRPIRRFPDRPFPGSLGLAHVNGLRGPRSTIHL
jgi:hypothetical protein